MLLVTMVAEIALVLLCTAINPKYHPLSYPSYLSAQNVLQSVAAVTMEK